MFAECLEVMIVYAHTLPPHPTSLFDMGRRPSSTNLSFVRNIQSSYLPTPVLKAEEMFMDGFFTSDFKS